MACELRSSKHARAFRNEVASVQEKDNEASKELWKIRVRDRISDLNDFLFEKGATAQYHRTWWAKLGWGFPLGWQFGWQRQQKEFNQPGDASVLFFSDLMRQAIGVTESQAQIEKVFGLASTYDMPVISCASPEFRRRRPA